MNENRDIERVSGLSILASGRKTSTFKSKMQKWRTLYAYALVYILEGRGVFESNASPEIAVKAGDCFFLYPGISHFYGPLGKDYWKEYWVIFRGSAADRFVKEKALVPTRPVVRLDPLRRRDFSRNLETLTDLTKRRPLDFRLKQCSLLYECLLQCMLPRDGTAASQGDAALLEGMKEILRHNIGNQDRMDSYFFLPGRSYHTLRAQFRGMTGQSPGAFLNELRMQRAEEQLLWTDFSIARICRGLGFDDPQYFSRMFRRHTGRSPRQYRERYHLIR